MRAGAIGALLSLISACAPSSDGRLDTYAGAFIIPDAETHHHVAKPWTSLDAQDSANRFHFLIVSDRTGGLRPGVFKDAAEKISLLQPAFVMSVGDLIEGYDYPNGYKEDRSALEAEWDAFDALLASVEAPFFHAPGDHDYSTRAMADVWRERHGRSYYHFLYKDTLFLVLNSELFDRTGTHWSWEGREDRFPDEQHAQLGYVARVLEDNEDVRWTFVFMHRPFWRSQWRKPAAGESAPSEGPWPKRTSVPADWPIVERLLAGRDHTVFAGDLHTYEFNGGAKQGRDRISLATTGGVSSLRGVAYGEFDHLVWVTMTEEGPVIANLLTEGVLPKNPPTPLKRPYWVD